MSGTPGRTRIAPLNTARHADFASKQIHQLEVITCPVMQGKSRRATHKQSPWEDSGAAMEAAYLAFLWCGFGAVRSIEVAGLSWPILQSSTIRHNRAAVPRSLRIWLFESNPPALGMRTNLPCSRLATMADDRFLIAVQRTSGESGSTFVK